MTVVVLYEDRVTMLAGLKLAALSLARCSPGLPLLAWVPGAPESFRDWARGVPGLTVRGSPGELRSTGWNVKPSVLQALLAEGQDEVVWFDSDIIANGDLRARLATVPRGTLVGTEEYFWGHGQGDDRRTRGLGLEPGRAFRATVNSGVLRVEPDHLPLLKAWSAILESPEYLSVQGSRSRPLHFWSDQEVLTGLLGAREFADLPVHQLRRGVDIAQCNGPSGFTVLERLRCGRSLPLLVHAMGPKPWAAGGAATARSPRERAGSPRERAESPRERAESPRERAESPRERALGYLEQLHHQLTPYVWVARHYRDELGEPAPWLQPRHRLARALAATLRPAPALQELPLALPDSLQRRVRRRLNLGQLA